MADDSILARSERRDPVSSLSLGDEGHVIAPAEDISAFHARFLRLVERRTAVYTMGDSTSVPAHVAEDILRSVCFVLGMDPEQPVVPDRLLSVDLEDEFRRNLADVERKVDLSGTLWRDACAAMPRIPNTALRDTLASIGDFPKLYDFRSMAHEIPCVFDYPLCQPVSESLLGVDYINEYLQRLLVEFDYLRRFALDACVYVLERSSPDHVDLLVNLYEPVATNSIGLALIGADPTPLRISDEERAEIARLLVPMGDPERDRVLREAALAACDALGVHDTRAREYLCALAPELLPRIEVGLAPGGELRGVFV